MSAHFFDKKPSEMLSIMVDFVNRLKIDETISNKDVSAIDKKTNQNVTDDIIDSSSIFEKAIIIKVKAGVAKCSYKITVRITTSLNAIIEDNVIMHVGE